MGFDTISLQINRRGAMDTRKTNPRRTAAPRNRNRQVIDARPAPRRHAQAGDTETEEISRRGAAQPAYEHPSRRRSVDSTAQGDFRQRRSEANRQAADHSRQSSVRNARQAYSRQSPRGSHETPAHQRHTRTRQPDSPRVGTQEGLSYQNLTPRRGTGTYVRHGYSPKKSKLPFLAGGIAAVLIVFILVNLAGALGSPSQESKEQEPAAADIEATPTSLTISFAGDCTLGTDENFSSDTSFNTKYESVGDPSYFMANVASIFAADDLTVANMEGTLTTATQREDKTYAFKGSADYAQVLVKGNIETASLANNHSHDYGEQSYTDTISALDAAGIDSFGYDRICYRDVKGVKVALIGTYELAKHLDIQEEMKQNIQTAKDNGAQITCVFFHWGNEKETVPDEIQVQLGHMAVDAGADLVVGSHPHVIQGYEKYNGRYIVYSLGNFCFGGNPNPSDKDCMIFQQTFTVTGNDVATDDNINVIPCSISSSSSYNNYQPTPAEGDEATRIQAKIEKSNASIATLSQQIAQQASSQSASSSSS